MLHFHLADQYYCGCSHDIAALLVEVSRNGDHVSGFFSLGPSVQATTVSTAPYFGTFRGSSLMLRLLRSCGSHAAVGINRAQRRGQMNTSIAPRVMLGLTNIVPWAVVGLFLAFIWKHVKVFVLKSPLDRIPGPKSASFTKGKQVHRRLRR